MECFCVPFLGALAMESLHRQVLPFLLRRLKEDVLQDLPPKIIQDYYCELSPLQVSLLISQKQFVGSIYTKQFVLEAGCEQVECSNKKLYGVNRSALPKQQKAYDRP